MLLVWVIDRMVLSVEVEPQPKDWVQEERKLDLRHVELELTLDNISRFPVGSFVCFLFVLFFYQSLLIAYSKSTLILLILSRSTMYLIRNIISRPQLQIDVTSEHKMKILEFEKAFCRAGPSCKHTFWFYLFLFINLLNYEPNDAHLNINLELGGNI